MKSWNEDPERNGFWCTLHDDAVRCIFDALTEDLLTAAALCVATPLQGVVAIRARKDWKNNPAFAIAVRLHTVGKRALNQALFRKYVHERCAEIIHLEWMNHHSRHFYIRIEQEQVDEGVIEEWRLVDNRQDEEYRPEYEVTNGCLLRLTTLWNGETQYYGGQGHINALVRWERDNGHVHYYNTDLVHDHEEGRSRLTCIQHNNGKSFTYYEGQPGNERRVRLEVNGKIRYYTGNRGEERKIYTRYPDGSIEHYLGARQEERKTRLEKDNKTAYFTGVKGQEKMTKVLLSDGRIVFYTGAKGEERMRRIVFSNGDIIYFRGVKGQERKRMLKKASGEVRFF